MNDENEKELREKVKKEALSSYFIEHFIYNIKQNETNKIYVYLGTYKYTDEIDIVHSAVDERKKYNDPKANYRMYRDLEQYDTLILSIKDSSVFEKENIIIKPNSIFLEREYYKIQEEFFDEILKSNQKKAKKRILNKYIKKNN